VRIKINFTHDNNTYYYTVNSSRQTDSRYETRSMAMYECHSAPSTAASCRHSTLRIEWFTSRAASSSYSLLIIIIIITDVSKSSLIPSWLPTSYLKTYAMSVLFYAFFEVVRETIIGRHLCNSNNAISLAARQAKCC